MTFQLGSRCLAIGVILLSVSTTLQAQQPATAPAVDAATTQPLAAPGEGLVYEVHAVSGKVLVAPIGMDPVKDAAQWRQVQVGEALGQGQQIRTLIRSSVKLVARPADPPTVILLESTSRMTIEQLAIREGQAVARLGLGYGAVRAGVAEGQTRSDMEIATPSAVLSKRGTDIFRVEYMNGRFNMSLSEQGRGLLQAIQLQFSNRGDVVGFRSRLVTPGQAVTQRMAQAIESLTWDREIHVNDMFGLVGNDRLFTLLNDRGFAFLLPFNSTSASIFGNPTAQPQGDGATTLTGGTLPITSTRGTRTIRDGDFGIGQTALPNLFDALRGRQVTRDRQGGAAATLKELQRQRSRDRLGYGRHR